MLEGQQNRHPGENAPRNVFIQLNTEKVILPLDVDGKVTKGSLYSRAALLGGFRNLEHSRPSLQEEYWLKEFLTSGGKDGKEIFTKRQGEVAGVIHYINQPDGKLPRKIVVYTVQGDHAWHGAKEEGDDSTGMKPNMNFPLSDIIVALITGKPEPSIK